MKGNADFKPSDLIGRATFQTLEHIVIHDGTKPSIYPRVSAYRGSGMGHETNIYLSTCTNACFKRGKPLMSALQQFIAFFLAVRSWCVQTLRTESMDCNTESDGV